MLRRGKMGFGFELAFVLAHLFTWRAHKGDYQCRSEVMQVRNAVPSGCGWKTVGGWRHCRRHCDIGRPELAKLSMSHTVR